MKKTLLFSLIASSMLSSSAMAGAVIGGYGNQGTINGELSGIGTKPAQEQLATPSTRQSPEELERLSQIADELNTRYDAGDPSVSMQDVMNAMGAVGGGTFMFDKQEPTVFPRNPTNGGGGGSVVTTPTVHGKFAQADGSYQNVGAGLEEMVRAGGGTITPVYVALGEQGDSQSGTIYIIKNLKKTIEWKSCQGNTDTPSVCSNIMTLTPESNVAVLPSHNKRPGADYVGYRIAQFRKSITVTVKDKFGSTTYATTTKKNIYGNGGTVNLDGWNKPSQQELDNAFTTYSAGGFTFRTIVWRNGLGVKQAETLLVPTIFNQYSPRYNHYWVK